MKLGGKTSVQFFIFIMLLGIIIISGCTSQNTAGNQSAKNSFSTSVPCPAVLFNMSPVPLDQVVAFTPIGQMSPPDHVFPAPHQYFYVIDPNVKKNVSVPIYAPANMVLTQIGLRHYNNLNGIPNYIDYTLVFSVCDGFQIYFHHVTHLTYQPFIDAANKLLPTCSFSGTVNEDFCSADENIQISSGTQFGTAGDINAGVYGLDIGARDYRIQTQNKFADPQKFCSSNGNIYDRCNAVCALDYATAEVKSEIQYKDPQGKIIAPCGNIFSDVTGSMQGYWFGSGGQQVSPESSNLYIGPNNLRLDEKVFSVGTNIPNTTPGLYEFIPTNSSVNNDPALISDSYIHCYNLSVSLSGDMNYRINVIVQLEGEKLKIERVNSCSDGFSNPVVFER